VSNICREEYRFIVYEIKALKKIFGPKMKFKGRKRRLYNVELHNMYSSPNIVRVIKLMIIE
jgi:hypothetical protein